MKPLTIEELRQTVVATAPNGEVIGTRNNFEKFHRVFLPENVNPAYVNLLTASSLMFVTLDHSEEGLDALVEALEKRGHDDLAMPVMNLVASIRMAKAVAIEGIGGVSKKFNF